jgi:hypothetical protein
MMGALLLGGVSTVLAQNEINERQWNQQKRIGERFPHRPRRLAREAEAAIHHEVKTERKANGERPRRRSGAR